MTGHSILRASCRSCSWVRGFLKQAAEDGGAIPDSYSHYDKVTRKTFPPNLKEVASERYFYDIPPRTLTQNVDLQIIEKAISGIESDCAGAMKALIESICDHDRIPAVLKPAIASFVALQFVRTPEFRYFFTQAHQKLVQTQRVNDDLSQICSDRSEEHSVVS